MPTPNAELAMLVGAIADDHADLRKLIVGLRGLSKTLREGAADATNALELITEFECEMIPHFAAEQAEEYFGALVAEQPRLMLRVERLQDEHREMAETVRQLVVFARADPGPALAAGLERFLEQFEAHEHAENALMQELVLLDEGSSGD